MSPTGAPTRDAGAGSGVVVDHGALGRVTTRFAVPAVAPDVLPRRRLLAALQAGVAGPLTLVSAPAGCGKSTLVAAWAALRDVPGVLTWVTLEEGDEQPDAFWSCLVEGLRRSGLPAASDCPSRTGPAARKTALVQLGSEIVAAEDPVVLVLDSADRVLGQGLWQEIGDLLGRTGDRLRLVLLTRRDPSLPLARRRLDGAVTEIRMADLAFTELETRTFLERAGVLLQPDELSALVARTAGWPAGIRFAVMSLLGRTDKALAIAEFSGTEGNVAEYLFTEVLDQKSPAMRDVLLRSSIVDTLRPGLLGVLTPSQPERCTLELVARGNAFLLPVPGTAGSYRYQPLFRDLLRAQLAYEQPSLVPVLHRAAAGWLAEHGELVDALRHAAAGHDWPSAAGFVVDRLAVGGLLPRHGDPTVQQVLRGIPAGVGGAAGAVVRAALALHDGDLLACRDELDLARSTVDDEPLQRARACRVATATLRALVEERTTEPEQAIRSAEEADRLLAAAGTVDALGLRAEVGLCRARLLVRQGGVGLAGAVLADLVAMAGEAGCSGVAAEGVGLASLLEAVNGNLGRAVEMARQVVGDDPVEPGTAEGAAIAGSVVPTAAVVALAWAHLERFDLRTAGDLACRAEVMANRDYDPVTSGALALVRLRLRSGHGPAPDTRPGDTAGSPDPLDAWLTEAVHGADVGSGTDSARPGVVVVGLVREAEHALRRGDVERARRLLGRSLDLAAPERLRRPFLQAPAPVMHLLRGGTALAVRHPWLRATQRDLAPRADAVVAPAAPEAPAPAALGGDGTAVVVEPLTAKEQEVLGHLAELLTTEEIAEAMFVSVNTVRTHVRGVLRKLAVTRRHEAVRRAWHLGLLQRSGVG